MGTYIKLDFIAFAEISAAHKEKSKMEQHKTDFVIEKKKLGNKYVDDDVPCCALFVQRTHLFILFSFRLENMQKGMRDAVDQCKKLEREYPWIASEEPHFGKAGGDYDWESQDPEKVCFIKKCIFLKAV